MRPRHKAAENAFNGFMAVPLPDDASMRPRHKAAENELAAPVEGEGRIGFNEAAA